MDNKTIKGPKICDTLDEIIRRIGLFFSWFNTLLVAVIILQVVLRYVFGMGLVVLEELQWHLYAIGIMLGLSYCTVENSHIRLDVLHDNLSQRNKELVELCGHLFLLLPIVIIILIHGWEFAMDAWNVKERSTSPIGLPARYIIKFFIPIGFGLLGLAALSKMLRSVAFLWKSNLRKET
jgi:TRAP-type mannitol/chloroaromatic compound transport system permease small subunit